MAAHAPSVVLTAAAIEHAVREGADTQAVVDLLAAERLTPEERVGVLQLLLEYGATADPHPADVAVCAFVELGYDEFVRRPLPTVLIDLREEAARKTAC